MNAVDTRAARATVGQRRRVLHIYGRTDGDFARELGVQVRMLCVWDWPARRPGDRPMMPGDLTPRHCKRCARVLVARRGGRA